MLCDTDSQSWNRVGICVSWFCMRLASCRREIYISLYVYINTCIGGTKDLVTSITRCFMDWHIKEGDNSYCYKIPLNSSSKAWKWMCCCWGWISNERPHEMSWQVPVFVIQSYFSSIESRFQTFLGFFYITVVKKRCMFKKAFVSASENKIINTLSLLYHLLWWHVDG